MSAKLAKDKFYSTSVNGKEMLVHFAFPKIFFTKNPLDLNERIFYKVGVMSNISWNQIATSAVETSMTSTQAIDIYSGSTYGQGQILFQLFYQDSLSLIKKNVFEGINSDGKNFVPEVAYNEDNPFVTITDVDIIESNSKTTSDPDQIEWIQMPLFDIYMTSMASGDDDTKKPSQYVIRAVKITSEGFGVAVDDLDISNVCTFISLKDFDGWKEVKDIYVV